MVLFGNVINQIIPVKLVQLHCSLVNVWRSCSHLVRCLNISLRLSYLWCCKLSVINGLRPSNCFSESPAVLFGRPNEVLQWVSKRLKQRLKLRTYAYIQNTHTVLMCILIIDMIKNYLHKSIVTKADVTSGFTLQTLVLMSSKFSNKSMNLLKSGPH